MTTRLEAIKVINNGGTLRKHFDPSLYGLVHSVEVAIEYRKVCDFQHRLQYQHSSIGPIHVRLWSAGVPNWVHITPKQLMRYIKRNYQR